MALGLLVDGKIDLAKSIVDHCIFEIKHYNKVLNGNRSYVSLLARNVLNLSIYADLNHRSSRIWLFKSSINSTVPTQNRIRLGSSVLSRRLSKNIMRIG